MSRYRLLWTWYPNDVYELNYTELRWFTYYRGQAGRLEFTCLWGDTFSIRPDFQPGQKVVFYCDGSPVFRGYIFDVRFYQGKYQVVCYDRTRYLLNRDSRIFYHQRASDIVKNILSCCGLPKGDITEIPYTVPLLTFRGETYLDMIGTVLNEAEKQLNLRYVLYDQSGFLYLTPLQQTGLNLKFTGENAIVEGERRVTIDEEFYTEVKLTQYSVDNPNYKSYTTQNSQNKKQYGCLRYYQQVDKDYNRVQVQNFAKSILKQNSTPKETIWVKALGDTRCRAGFRPYFSLPQLDIEGSYLIRSAEHIISGTAGYVMKLECVK